MSVGGSRRIRGEAKSQNCGQWQTCNSPIASAERADISSSLVEQRLLTLFDINQTGAFWPSAKCTVLTYGPSVQSPQRSPMIWITRHLLTIGVAILASFFAASGLAIALFRHAMQTLIVGTDRAAFWVAASLTAHAALIATLAKSAFPVKRAEFVYNVPRLLAAEAVEAALLATTRRAASAARYAVALSITR
jgi:hypothetical protein